MGIVAEMSNGDTPSDSESEEGYETPPEGSTDDTHDSDNGAGETSERTASPINTGLSQESATDDSNQKLQKVESTSGASNVSNESTEDEVKQKPNKDKALIQNDVLYTGMMYHEEKKVGYWRAIYSVVRDLEVLKQYISTNHPNAELGNDVDFFKFSEPNGKLLLLLETTQLQLGWTVDPDREPMELFQSTIDHFPLNPLYSSCSMSVYAEIGVAKKPLHCPIKLTGIDPSKILYINKSPPALPPPSINSTSSSSSTASISQTRRETEEDTFRSDIAHRVMTENIVLIKETQIDLYFLADKLLEKGIINGRERSQVTDEHCGLTADQRLHKLLNIIIGTIRVDGEVFGIFLDILREEGTRRTIKLADKLLEKYNNI